MVGWATVRDLPFFWEGRALECPTDLLSGGSWNSFFRVKITSADITIAHQLLSLTLSLVFLLVSSISSPL